MKNTNTVKKTRLELYIEHYWNKNEPVTSEFIEHIKNNFLDPNEDPNELIEMEYEVFTCSICGRRIDDSYSNNAQPINNGRCCDRCNAKYVIPARINRMRVGLDPRAVR